jgi:predicted nucleic acid-binding Zn finger protein
VLWEPGRVTLEATLQQGTKDKQKPIVTSVSVYSVNLGKGPEIIVECDCSCTDLDGSMNERKSREEGTCCPHVVSMLLIRGQHETRHIRALDERGVLTLKKRISRAMAERLSVVLHSIDEEHTDGGTAATEWGQAIGESYECVGVSKLGVRGVPTVPSQLQSHGTCMMCPEGVRATRNTYLLTPDQYFLVCRTCEACQRRTDRLYPNGLTQARSKIFKGKPTSGQTFEGVLALVVTWNTGSYIARLLAVKTKARATALEESNQVRNHALESVRRATADAAAADAAAAAAALAYAPAAPAVLSTGSVGGAGGGGGTVSGGGSKGLSGLAAALHKARGKDGIGGMGARMCGRTSSSAVVAAAAVAVATLAAPAPAW